MFSYRCRNCGASAHSAANVSLVRPCPHCGEHLGLVEPGSVPAPSRAAARPRTGARAPTGRHGATGARR
jgi:predicted  nucleic acid-binding Zn-ribbon protein